MATAPHDFTPVLLGADLNCYSVARAFHEAYGVKTQAFGKQSLGFTAHSRIVNFTVEPHLDDSALCVRLLRDYAERHTGRPLILMGCTDEYAAFLIEHRDELSDLYLLPYMDAHLMEGLVDKADFYESCEKFGIPYPKTVILSSPADKDAYSETALGFSYPIIVKPSSSIEYWRHPFKGMKKVYVAQTSEEADAIVREIYASGYDRRMILQDMIPGGDDHMRVLTAYSDKDKKVKMMCMGHVLLEEHTPKGLGNHAAIITEKLPCVAEKLRAMLNTLGVRGFTNFDLKMDDRDGTYKVFEINLRQGRSNNYLTASGINIARLVAEDYVYAQTLPEITEAREVFWHSIPKKIVYRYVEDEALAARAKALDKKDLSRTPLLYGYDLCRSPRRLFFVLMHLHRQHKKYATYCKRYR